MKILVVGPSWIGDIVLSHTLFQLLIDLHRDASGSSCIIDVLAPGWSAPLYNRMPEVRRVIDMPLGHGKLGLGLRRQLGQTLRKEGYGQAIVLPNSFKSAIVPFAAKVPVRIGWRGEMRYALLNDVRVLREEQYPSLMERFAALAYPEGASLPSTLPMPHLMTYFSKAKEVCDKFNLRYERGPIVALCPREQHTVGGSVAGSVLKVSRTEKAPAFSAEQYGQLAEGLMVRGYQVWLLGTAKQRAFAKAIVRAAEGTSSGRLINLVGSASLDEAVDLLSQAHCVVTDDPGLKQLSAALERPAVSIEQEGEPSSVSEVLQTALAQVDHCLADQHAILDCALSR